MADWPTAVLELLFPPRCVGPGCARRGAWLCAGCRARVRPVPGPRCARCGLPSAGRRACPDCAAVLPAFDRAVAGGAYEAPLREAIRAFKYARTAGLAEVLGDIAADALGAETADIVVAVPGHRRRVAARGVDHAALLARAVARRRRLPWAPRTLLRTRSTRPQAGLDPSARRDNVAGAFRATVPLAGMTVLLVDDVLTTGATASACAQALRAAGARRVTVCTAARALTRAGVAAPRGL